MDLHYLSVSYDSRSAEVFLIALVSHRFASPHSFAQTVNSFLFSQAYVELYIHKLLLHLPFSVYILKSELQIHFLQKI